MPAKITALPLLIQRQVMHLVMYGFVAAHRSALPGVSIDNVVELFLKWWGTTGPKPATLKATYFDMQKEHLDLQRTTPEEKQFQVQLEVAGRDLTMCISAPSPQEASTMVEEQFRFNDVRINRVTEYNPLIPAA